MRRTILLVAFVLFGAMIPATSALATPTFDQAVDQLYADGYPQSVAAYLVAQGTNPELGFRWGGTTADNAVAAYLAHEFAKMGLQRVRLEEAPMDVFEFKHADVTAGGRHLVASTFSGVPPTPKDGLTGDVVYVHTGSATDFDAAGDVRDKLVLVDAQMDLWWFNYPALEAGHRGAAGVILTTTPANTYWTASPDALGSLDAMYDWGGPPIVYLSQTDGDWLKTQIAGGPFEATMTLDIKVRMESEGGFGYNTLAELPGTSGDDQQTVMLAYHDAHFRRGLNDAGAVANLMTIAKAMRMSGYRPKHTIVFLVTAGEEGSLTNAYYDWLNGSWGCIQDHPDWAGRTRGAINLENMALDNAAFEMTSDPELRPHLKALAEANASLLPFGTTYGPVSDWNDQFVFSATGTPSVTVDTRNDVVDAVSYSDADTTALIDWGYNAKLAKFIERLSARFDTGVLPYSYGARAVELRPTVKSSDLRDAGASKGVVSRIVKAARRFSVVAKRFDAHAASIPARRAAATNRAMLKITRTINDQLTAIQIWDPIIYPHEQVLWDVQGLSAAISALRSTPVDKAAALAALEGTAKTSYGLSFSYPVYLRETARQDPAYARIRWGAEGQLPERLDVVPEYRMIEAERYADALSSLSTKRADRVTSLNTRLTRMARILERVTPQLEALY